MTEATATQDESADRVAAVRRFNRFYTRQIGVLNEGLLKSPFTLTQVRVLYELAYGGEQTAHEVRRESCVIANLRFAPNRIIIPAYKIQIRSQVVVIQFRVNSHKVMRDKVLWTFFPKNFDLLRLKTDDEP